MTQAEVKRLIRRIGLRPQRAAGQNFLLDELVCQEMIEIAEITKADTVLEIGPGLGILTERLLATGANVIGVELDQRLAGYLLGRYRNQSRVKIIRNDIFKEDLNAHVTDRGYKVVANLPYSATSLVFRNFLTTKPRPTRLTVMIQKEVAERIVAEPGQMNMLGLTVQYFTEATFVATVPRTSFWPAPEVTSAIIDVRPKTQEPDPGLTKHLFQIAKVAFAGKRKTLLNSLTALPPYNRELVAQKLQTVGINPGLRPQALSLKDWRKIAKILV